MNAEELMAREPHGYLWVHPAYNGGPMGLITLHCTYDFETRVCMENYLGGLDDRSFDWLTIHGFQAASRNLAPLENMAITNYLEEIYPSNNPGRPLVHYRDSAAPYSARLKRLELVGNLIIAGEGELEDGSLINDWPVTVTSENSGAEILRGPHPQGANRWAHLRQELARLVSGASAHSQAGAGGIAVEIRWS
jgi:hypothetical protein